MFNGIEKIYYNNKYLQAIFQTKAFLQNKVQPREE